MKVFLGIDWGGTYVKAVIVDTKGKILKKKIFTSHELQNKNSFINNVGVLLHTFTGFNIKAVGIGAPGIINIKQGQIYYLPNIEGWENYPLKRVLQNKYKLPVYIDKSPLIEVVVSNLPSPQADIPPSVPLNEISQLSSMSNSAAVMVPLAQLYTSNSSSKFKTLSRLLGTVKLASPTHPPALGGFAHAPGSSVCVGVGVDVGVWVGVGVYTTIG